MALGGICQGSDTRGKSGTGSGLAGTIGSGDMTRIITGGDKPMEEPFSPLRGRKKATDMTENTDIYVGIEGKNLVYHSPYYHKDAYFFRIISQTKKMIVVQRLRNKVIREHKIGGYWDVIPLEEPADDRPRRMIKTFDPPNLVKGYVEGGTCYLELWDGLPCMEDPMY